MWNVEIVLYLVFEIQILFFKTPFGALCFFLENVKIPHPENDILGV